MEKKMILTGDVTITYYQQMFSNLNGVRKLPSDMQDIISKNTEAIALSKKYTVLPFHKTCTHCYFIVKGRMKVYEIDNNGKENILWLLKEGDVVTAPQSFISQTPSMESIQTLERTICIHLSHEVMLNILFPLPEFKDLYIELNHTYYMRKCEIEKMKSKEPEERYRQFIEENPDLASRCTDKDIANFLGLARETVSRYKNAFKKSDVNEGIE